MSESILISCDDCVVQATPACDDCLVTFFCDREPDDTVIMASEEERAIRLLVGSGLVPRLRHARRGGSGCFSAPAR